MCLEELQFRFKRKIRSWTEIWTSDLQISSLALYHLSYSGSIDCTGINYIEHKHYTVQLINSMAYRTQIFNGLLNPRHYVTFQKKNTTWGFSITPNHQTGEPLLTWCPRLRIHYTARMNSKYSLNSHWFKCNKTLFISRYRVICRDWSS